MTASQNAMRSVADNSKKKVVIIGAGMVGICAASYIQRAGHDVVIVDPDPPGEGASFGNAGCFNPSSVVPIAGPDTLKKVPGYLLDPLGPLAIRWRYLPQIAPWLLRYAYAGSSAARVEKQAEALKTLIWGSLDYLMPLVANAHAEALVKRNGILIVYRSERSWQADERAWDIRRRAGIFLARAQHRRVAAIRSKPGARPDPRQACSWKRSYRRSWRSCRGACVGGDRRRRKDRPRQGDRLQNRKRKTARSHNRNRRNSRRCRDHRRRRLLQDAGCNGRRHGCRSRPNAAII